MRSSSLAFCAVALIFSVATGSVALAGTGVLLPSGNDRAKATMGLAPQSSPSKDSSDATPPPSSKQNGANNAAPLPPAPTAAATTPSVDTNGLLSSIRNKLLPFLSPNKKAAVTPPNYTSAMSPGSMSLYLPHISMPTMVIKVPTTDPAILQDPNAPPLPHAMTVGFADRPVWGPVDLENVNDHLGIPTQQVNSTCNMSVSGFAATSVQNGFYLFDTGGASSTTLRYDGAVRMITARIEALCALVDLPSDRGYVVQKGDKYSVNLSALQCQIPASLTAPQKMLVYYAGNGSSQCRFQ